MTLVYLCSWLRHPSYYSLTHHGGCLPSPRVYCIYSHWTISLYRFHCVVPDPYSNHRVAIAYRRQLAPFRHPLVSGAKWTGIVVDEFDPLDVKLTLLPCSRGSEDTHTHLMSVHLQVVHSRVKPAHHYNPILVPGRALG